MEKSFLQNEGGYTDALKHQKRRDKGKVYIGMVSCIIVYLGL